MASLSKHSLKQELLKDKLAKEEAGGKKEEDSRYLPFYNLKERETMKIVFLPDENSDLFVKYRTHGGNIRVPGVKTINCAYSSSGESCPACQLSFQHYNDGDKDEAAKWRSKETYITQCVVIESDIEIPENEDGNWVKLMYLPWKVKEKITEAVLSGEIEDPSEHVFVLKKNVNSGGFNTYENSYWLHKPLEEVVPPEFFEAVEEGLIEPYNLTDELPTATSAEEVQEWLDDALSKVEYSQKAKENAAGVRTKASAARKSSNENTERGSDHDDDQGEPEPTKLATPGEQGASDEGDSDRASRASSLRERLRSRTR